MPTDKIRKYILPNIPYLFIGWAFLKLGTAYRLAAGANAGEKLLGLMQTIGVAFADFSPGLDPFDWLVGIVGAVAFRLLIYFKSKNAKKFRRDEEYGSARWGTEKDIKPFVDPKFENNIILTRTEKLTILAEAEKYIGYPYVWGGYKPSTSFDCSGFVSYVYNQCGWDFGRLGAQGLYNISTRVSLPRPGDLVFFTGTYDTPGVSHVGIYVGDGWMLHCGDPIGYANLNTSYWQSHFYAYGRLS